MTKNSKASVYGLLILSVLLWAALSDAWGYSERFLTGIPDAWRKYLYAYLSRLIWVLPFLLSVLTQNQEGTLPPKQLFGFHFHWQSFWLSLAVSTLYILCGMFLTHGGWWIHPTLPPAREMGKLLIVGFVEELVYRGFALNRLSAFMSGRRANLVSSVFFAALHVPAYFIHWYRGAPFSGAAMLTQVISSFILGLIFGLLFQKSKSVWAPAIVHFWYDFSFVFFIG